MSGVVAKAMQQSMLHQAQQQAISQQQAGVVGANPPHASTSTTNTTTTPLVGNSISTPSPRGFALTTPIIILSLLQAPGLPYMGPTGVGGSNKVGDPMLDLSLLTTVNKDKLLASAGISSQVLKDIPQINDAC